MTKFTIKVVETNSGVITVEAESRNSAKEIARAMWYQGDTEWTDGDSVFTIIGEDELAKTS